MSVSRRTILLARANFAGRVEFPDRAEEMADGLSVHPAPGHIIPATTRW